MAAHRYWRLVGFAVAGAGDMEVRQIQLLGSAGVLSGGTLSSSHAPVVGDLPSLVDGSAPSVRFEGAAVRSPGFWLRWDFGGAPVEAVSAQIRASQSAAGFPALFTLEYADAVAGPWAGGLSLGRFQYPGEGSTVGAAVELIETESFTTNPAGKYQTVLGAPAVAWDAAGEALNYSGWDTQNFCIFPAMAKLPLDFDVEADINFVADSAVRKHIGLFIGNAGGAGYRFFTLDGATGISLWQGTAETWPAATIVTSGNPCIAGGAYTFRAQKIGSELSLWINGTRYCYINGTPALTGLRPGLFVYGAQLKVHELRSKFLSYEGTSQAPVFVQNLPLPIGISGSALPNGAASSNLREYAFFDAYHGGIGIIYGTVKEKQTPANAPLRRKVRLLDERSGLVIRETWSDAATGAYEFRGIKQGVPYTVLAYDHAHNYRAFAGDNLLPDPMP